MKNAKYTVRMPDVLAAILKQTSFVTGVSMNKIFYICVKGFLKEWLKKRKAPAPGCHFPDWKNKTLKQFDEAISKSDVWYKNIAAE